MTRVDLCTSEDEVALAEFVMAIEELGGVAADGGPMAPGTGLNRYRIGQEEVTVFMDAWGADLAGPEQLVRRILNRMAGLE